jgi:glycosyltransferase involved in cell wall biosynthesis
MVGGCRNDGDRARVNALCDMGVRELGLTEGSDFEIHVNVSYDALKDWLTRGTIGIHTMTDEHFGIGVVEFLAAGCVVGRPGENRALWENREVYPWHRRRSAHPCLSGAFP